LPLLKNGRIVFSSSAGHAQAPPGGVDYNSITKQGTELNPWTEYGQSKWGNIALAKQLDKLYGPQAGGQMVALSVHPGTKYALIRADD
jgi:NAD(P)-dependent dehydrogenase (short-subunit alcohol dehydrogenase family)